MGNVSGILSDVQSVASGTKTPTQGTQGKAAGMKPMELPIYSGISGLYNMATGGSNANNPYGEQKLQLEATGKLGDKAGLLGAGVGLAMDISQWKKRKRATAALRDKTAFANTLKDKEMSAATQDTTSLAGASSFPIAMAKDGMAVKEDKVVEIEKDEVLIRKDDSGKWFIVLDTGKHTRAHASENMEGGKKETGADIVAKPGDQIFNKKLKQQVIAAVKAGDDKAIDKLIQTREDMRPGSYKAGIKAAMKKKMMDGGEVQQSQQQQQPAGDVAICPTTKKPCENGCKGVCKLEQDMQQQEPQQYGGGGPVKGTVNFSRLTDAEKTEFINWSKAQTNANGMTVHAELSESINNKKMPSKDYISEWYYSKYPERTSQFDDEQAPTGPDMSKGYDNEMAPTGADMSKGYDNQVYDAETGGNMAMGNKPASSGMKQSARVKAMSKVSTSQENRTPEQMASGTPVEVPVADVDAKDDNKKEYGGTFKEAFATARKELGKGKVFIYKGKPYTTNYAEEENSKGSGAAAGSKSTGTDKAPVKADLTDVNPNDPNYAYMLLADEAIAADEKTKAEKKAAFEASNEAYSKVDVENRTKKRLKAMKEADKYIEDYDLSSNGPQEYEQDRVSNSFFQVKNDSKLRDHFFHGKYKEAEFIDDMRTTFKQIDKKQLSLRKRAIERAKQQQDASTRPAYGQK